MSTVHPPAHENDACDYTVCSSLEFNGRKRGGFIRVVKPYVHIFTTRAKRRWIGRTVLHVYTSEFGAFPLSYYEPAILQGRILVNGKQVALYYELSNNDVLTHTVHMHEPAVDMGAESSQLKVIAETNDVIVVNKPCTLTVHPCGSYQHNSLLSMLESEYGGKLYTIHRLDRLTSGLVVLAKTPCVARRWTEALTQRECDKIYLARVKGRFPLNCEINRLSRINDREPPKEGKWNIVADTGKRYNDVDLRSRIAVGYWISNHDGTLQNEDIELTGLLCEHSVDEWLARNDACANDTTNLNWFHVACPTRISHHKNARCEAGSFVDLSDALYNKSVKPAHTAFGVVSYDAASDSTVLLCRPFTGRSHQIRMHLQILGHPIVNDSKYGGDEPNVCKEARAELNAMSIAGANDNMLTTDAFHEEDESFSAFIERTCSLCARNESDRNKRSMLELLSNGRGIWLHALQMTMEDEDGKIHCYRTNVPAWARREAS